MEKLQWAASWIGCLSVICGAGAVVVKCLREFSKIIAGLKCQLRSGMLHTYYKNHEGKTIRQYELENFLLQYKAYKAMKGNSFIDDVYREVLTWQMVA